MINKVLNTIKYNNMFSKGDKVIVGLSGGPDSVCMIHILYKLKDILGIDIVAAHINHCLRGKDADDDESYTRELCNNLQIECFVKKEDVHNIAKEKGISCEMAGREVRYEFFNEILNKVKGSKIAIAHNLNDQAETVFMRILRGAGLDGLEGIKPVREKKYVRPIIDLSREEIELYCEENKLKPRIDKTNLENIYTRNKVRLDLFPYIQENFNSDIIHTLNRMASTITIDNEYMREVSNKLYRKYCKNTCGKVIINKEVFKEHKAVLTRVIRIGLERLKGNICNIDKGHIYDIIKLQQNDTGKMIMLPNNIKVLNNYKNVEIFINDSISNKDTKNFEGKLKVNTINNLEDMNLKVSLNVLDKENMNSADKNSLIKYFDYDKINKDIKIRYRKNGDKIIPLGMKGNKKLKDLFIDLKIPKEKRNNIPIIESGDDIAWVVGYRISEKFKVDENSTRILEIKIDMED